MMKPIIMIMVLSFGNSSCQSTLGTKYDRDSILLHYVTQQGVKRVVDLREGNKLTGPNGRMIAVIGEFAGLIPGRKALIKDKRIYAGKETFDMLQIDRTYIKGHKNVIHVLGYIENADGKVFLDPWIMPTHEVIPW